MLRGLAILGALLLAGCDVPVEPDWQAVSFTMDGRRYQVSVPPGARSRSVLGCEASTPWDSLCGCPVDMAGEGPLLPWGGSLRARWGCGRSERGISLEPVTGPRARYRFNRRVGRNVVAFNRTFPTSCQPHVEDTYKGLVRVGGHRLAFSCVNVGACLDILATLRPDRG